MNTTTVTATEHSLADLGHVLIFDSPVGTGFSYSETGEFVTTHAQGGQQVVTAFTNLMTSGVLSSYLAKDQATFLAGESDGGKWVSEVGAAWLAKPPSGAHLGGLIAGNGWYDAESQVGHEPDYLYNLGMLSATQAAAFAVRAKEVLTLIHLGNYSGANDLYGAYQVDLFMATGLPDPADVRVYGFASLNFTTVLDVVNDPATRARLGVGNHTYDSVISQAVGNALALDNLRSAKPALEKVLGAPNEIPMMMFHGNFDYTIPNAATESFLAALQWPGKQAYVAAPRNVWRDSNNATLGYSQIGGNMHYYTVAQSGHQAIQDHPERVLAAISAFLGATAQRRH
jgi:carboxypeptidase C (cathepsin A)